jgi:asparagine synthase (glutamine-hydrolysing)
MQRRLLKVDRASMAHGLEVRLPFLDQEVINFMNGVIPSLGVKHRVPKILLKTCLWKHLPKNLVLNQKQGFSINLNNLLRNELKQNVQGTLIDSKSIFDNHIDKGAVSNQTQNYMSNEHHNGWSIWTLFSLYKFADLHLDK